MKSVKKLLSLVLMIVMLAGTLQIPAFAAGAVTIRLVPEKTEVEPGETIKVDIEIENNPSLSMAEFHFEADEGITFTIPSSVESGYLMANASGLTHDYASGTSMMMFCHDYNTDDLWITEDGKLACLTITVPEDAAAGQSYAIDFATQSFASYLDENYDDIDLNPSFVGATVTVEGGSNAAEDAVVYVSGAKGGSLYLVNKAVTVKDINEDGLLSYDEALQAAHDQYCPGGYTSSWGAFGIQVGKVWGEGNGDFANAYFLNNNKGLQMNVGESYVEAGDHLYACSLKYPDSWNDTYSYFNDTSVTVDAGEEFTLTLRGSSYFGNGADLSEISVGIWSDGSFTALNGEKFDENAQVTLSFNKAGTYIVSAEGEFYDDYGLSPIMPPYCIVTVNEGASCGHTNTSESTSYVTENETHTPVTTVVCGDCGETVSTTTGEPASCGDNDKNGKCDVCGGAVKVEEEISGLTASIEGNQTVEIGDTAQVKLFINSDNADEVYNAFKIEVDYDASVLTYSDNSFTNDAYNVSDNGQGKLIIDGYGDDINVSGETELVTLDFTAKAAGEGEVEITKAFANDRGVAIASDIQPIALSSNSVAAVTINAPKATYTVTFEGNGAEDANGDSEVTEGDDYTFTVTKKDGYTYEISATMGGEEYDLNGGYTIKNVTGDIVITVSRTSTSVEPDPDSYPVTLPEGVTGNNTATEGEDYTFTVPEGAGEPTVTVGGETVEIGDGTENDDGSVTYTIPGDKVTGAIVVTLPAAEITVEVSDYFKFEDNESEGGVMKLVVAKANLGENKVLTYDTNAMYWSAQYQGYAYLVPVNAQLTEEDAKAMVAIADGNAASIDNGVDVNESGVIDINDAQLTYDIYKAEYNDFTSVSMKKMLRADVINDREVNVNDVTAVVAIVRN